MDKSTGSKPDPRMESSTGRLAQRSGFATPWTRTGFQGFRGCETVLQERFDGDTCGQGAMTQYWAFARGGAWRNPKPPGGLYVCEQCRLDARSGNDSTLTLQAVTAIELGPYGRMRRLRGAVVGGSGGPRSSLEWQLL